MYEVDLTTFNIENIIIYLRKSRKDLEYGNNESIEKTLQRHEEILQKWAINNLGSKISKSHIYREVASGDTISDRPIIQEILKLIEQPNIEGVLCLEVERLARGNTIDQGIIVQTFQYTNTKIITPQKIFDLENDFDRSFFEDGLHHARKYLEYTKKILSRGRLSSVNEGKFVGSTPPYGYTKEKLKGQKGYKLVPLEEEARVVKVIFQKAEEGLKSQKITNHLNNLNIKPRKNDEWSSSTIRDILKNPVYYGMIKWNHRKTEKKMIDGVIYKSRPNHSDYILVKGLHEPLITKKLYDIVNKKTSQNAGKSVTNNNELQNPLAGLIKCSVCGRTMQRKNYRSGHIDGLICPRPYCKNVGSHLYLVEEKVIDSLDEILKEFTSIVDNFNNDVKIDTTEDENTLKIINNEIDKLEKQLNKAYDLLEQNIYDNNTFLNRSSSLKEKINNLNKEKQKYVTSDRNKINKIKNIIPNIKKVIDDYNNNLTPDEKNQLLTAIIDHVDYLKFKKGRSHEDEFSLKIKVKL